MAEAASRKRRSTVSTVITAIVLLAFAALIASNGFKLYERVGYPQWNAAKAGVLAELGKSDTVSFCWRWDGRVIEGKRKGRFGVVGYFDTQDERGAKARKGFIAAVEKQGEKWKSVRVAFYPPDMLAVVDKAAALLAEAEVLTGAVELEKKDAQSAPKAKR